MSICSTVVCLWQDCFFASADQFAPHAYILHTKKEPSLPPPMLSMTAGLQDDEGPFATRSRTLAADKPCLQ